MSQLVSVVVSTYNSAAFVVETLESIYHQTHQNIQLIVSDDCSKDTSVEIVEKWCSQTRVKARFTNIKIMTVPQNTGVSANGNRMLKSADSKWIKFIAGDDILLPNCISDNMIYVAENPESRIIFSQVHVYQDTFEQNNFVKSLPALYPDNLMHISFTALDQFKLLLESDRISYTPSFFFNKKTIEEIGGYDETNRLVEDYPMWLKLTKAGIKLYYFHIPTVGYRIHSKATNNTGENLLFKPSVINSYKIRKKYAHPYLPSGLVYQEQWVYHLTLLFKNLNITKKSKLNFALYKFMTVYTNPFLYYNSLRKKISSLFKTSI